MKKGKIVSLTFVKTWSGDKGTVYYHDIEFDNGDKGQAGFKSECPAEYAAGTEHSYELTPNGNYAAKLKFVKENAGGGFAAKKPASNAGFALAYSKDIFIASVTEGSKMDPLKTDQMFLLAEKMFAWLEARK